MGQVRALTGRQMGGKRQDQTPGFSFVVIHHTSKPDIQIVSIDSESPHYT
jgi:hypothetical protein